MVIAPRTAAGCVDARTALIDAWDPARPGDLAKQAAILVIGRRIENAEHPLGPAAFHHRLVARAPIWWVTSAMVDLLEAAYDTVPDGTRIDDDLIAAPEGLVFFQRPLHLTDAQTDGDIIVDAFTWTIGPGASGEELAFAFYHWTSDIPCGALFLNGTNWPTGHPIEQIDVLASIDDVDTFERSVREDRNIAAALWLLAAQPHLGQITDAAVDRATVRRAKRSGVDANVSIVDLRARPQAHAGNGTGTSLGHRVPVAGHWRSQPYGPGSQYRRPTFVAPHIRGPEGTPLVVRQKVNVLRP